MDYSTNTKEPIVFKVDIPAGGKLTFQERVKAPGTVEGVRVRFYPGQEMELHVTPYIEHKGRRIEQLVTYAEGTLGYLSGDDDTISLPTIVNVDYDDYVKVYAENKSGFTYTLDVMVFVDYFGGGNRVIGGVMNG